MKPLIYIAFLYALTATACLAICYRNKLVRAKRVRRRWNAAGLPLCLALVVLGGLAGCSAQQKTDLVQKEVQLAAAADEGLTFFQKQLALAQDVMTAYQAELAATAVDDKSRVKTQAKLAKAQAEVTKYQMYLALAKVGIKLVEAQAVPATQPTQ